MAGRAAVCCWTDVGRMQDRQGLTDDRPSADVANGRDTKIFFRGAPATASSGHETSRPGLHSDCQMITFCTRFVDADGAP